MVFAMKHGFNPAIKHLYRHSEAKHGNEEHGAFLLCSHCLLVFWENASSWTIPDQGLFRQNRMDSGAT
jgi:hypothetical protein